MTVSNKITTIHNKLEKIKAKFELEDKLLIFWPYHQEMLVDINF